MAQRSKLYLSLDNSKCTCPCSNSKLICKRHNCRIRARFINSNSNIIVSLPRPRPSCNKQEALIIIRIFRLNAPQLAMCQEQPGKVDSGLWFLSTSGIIFLNASKFIEFLSLENYFYNFLSCKNSN